MQPLAGITVIDATQALVGPFTGQTLGDLGADVIKVERPGHGDLTRTYSPQYGEELSAYFVSTNRNKRSISLDLTTAEGQAILHDLVAGADVFVQNFSPGKAKAFGAEYETLSSVTDDLVYCDISGYGEDSPYADRKSFDIILQGESGMMSVTGTEAQPARIGVSICDLAGAMTAIYSILTALYHRERTGEGQYIDVSLLDASFQFLGYHVSNYFATGENPGRMGTRHPSLMPYQAFETADSHIVVGVVSEHIWPKLCRAIGREEWIDDERYATFSDRVENRGELDPVLDDIFSARPTDEWMTILQNENVPCTPVRDVETLVDDPHIETRGMIAEMEHPELGTFKSPANPVNFSSLETDADGPPPRLGEHTDEVLAELGFDESERDRLRSDGIVHSNN
ncbi:CaiB/BaiF CoA transferase family protein [Natronorubrum texcoconense]|uniref:Formyl-CoA transferase n=1 Tax=Natronorubrum texcoconense TaxID=1095776 RepID=A0A1G9CPU3_9EURY|nr:CaiB/BaiF CoA-transferase family protein [Natronorubrum texcoconense]SDK53475.1 formyl-CoA transferase [Natronorubrum texcoconense]